MYKGLNRNWSNPDAKTRRCQRRKNPQDSAVFWPGVAEMSQSSGNFFGRFLGLYGYCLLL